MRDLKEHRDYHGKKTERKKLLLMFSTLWFSSDAQTHTQKPERESGTSKEI